MYVRCNLSGDTFYDLWAACPLYVSVHYSVQDVRVISAPGSTRVFRASGMVYPHEGFKRNKRLGSWLVIRCYYKYLFLSFLSGCFFDCFFSFDHYSGGVVLFWLTPDIYIYLSLSGVRPLHGVLCTTDIHICRTLHHLTAITDSSSYCTHNTASTQLAN